MIFLTGISITGLETALTVGHQNVTINCMTNVAVDSIEWRDQSSVLNTSSDVNLRVLEYTIPLVRDDLQGEPFTCTAMAGDTTYNETVNINVTGTLFAGTVYTIRAFTYIFISPVSPGSLKVKTDVSAKGPQEAGSTDLTLTCTVSETISGLTDMPSAHWSGPVTSGDDIVVSETLRNATTVTVDLTFSSLHTSHAGQYTCQGTLVSPAAEENIISTVSVNVSCK